MPAALAFGAVVDIAAGWDGTLWAIDQQGAPSVYDAVAWAGSVSATPATPTPTPGISGTSTPGTTATPRDTV